MSILEPEKIDILATRPDSKVVKLVVADHLAWDDVSAHSRLLQEKINAYLAFIESGQVRAMKKPKIPESPEMRIVLAAQCAPNDEAKRFLLQVGEFLRGVGIGFDLEVHEGS